jgi:glycosyltransferase involved in cell wall biosynthesis
MKISVGIPVYDNKLAVEVASCLLTEKSIAQMMGDQLNVRFLPGCCNLAMGRNQIVKEFLESDDDKLVFLDADVTFQPGGLVKLAHYPVDMVGGAYRLKQDIEEYPVAFLDKDELWANEMGLLEVAMVPTGFLSLSRDVFKKFRQAYPGRFYESRHEQSYCYFQIPYRDGALYTEDAYFCREWRQAGGKIWLDPELYLTHWQYNKPFKGHIGQWLKGRGCQPQQET